MTISQAFSGYLPDSPSFALRFYLLGPGFISSITVTVSHAIAYLTRPLVAFMPASTVTKLQLALEANLTAHYAHSWVPSEPLRGSGRRCLSISPTSLPPRPIYASCVAAKVQWSEWMTALGNVEFDLFVDPGLVSVRFIQRGATSKLITVWSDDGAEEPRSQSEGSRASASPAQHRVQSSAKAEPVLPTLAQQLMIEDEEDEEELFAALANELREPTWTTPVLHQFPSTIPQKSKPSSASHHSRSSSRSSDTSGTEGSTLSRRERARKARVFIDTSKKEVTNYDGGKTTVLTGGVMLGGRPVPAKPANAATSSCNWRSSRA
ncbi:hypothetical protein EDB87DRAFT_555586 [Lactarius vividus]|nr:hypothetical protein EDB87DRAFT_555586 [Lactarius vividus]